MDAPFVLIATVILLMALHAGDAGSRRRSGKVERRIMLPNRPSGGGSSRAPLPE